MPRRLMSFALGTLILALLLSAAATPVAAGPGGNRASAKLCQKGGWEELQRADGTPFASQDECVSYGAQGGVPEPIPVYTPTLQVLLNSGPIGGCEWRIEGTGFEPNTTYQFDRYIGGEYWFSQNYTVDVNGNIFIAGGANSGLSSFQVKAYALTDLGTPVAVSNVGTC